MKKKFIFSVIIAFALAAFTAFAVDVPFLTGRVTDNAQILSDETRKAVTANLKAHEEKTTNQIAVLTVPTLDGVSIEEYAVTVFNTWKLGQKGKDNGILLIVAPKDRNMRIEVGYGLEGTMTDGIAGSIIRNAITPFFKNNDYDRGIDEGVRAIINVLEGGQAPAETAKSGEEVKKPSALNMEVADISVTEKILFGAFIFGIIGLFTAIGILTPGMGWFLYFFLIPFWATFPIVVLGTSGTLYLLITYVVGFPIAKLLLTRTDWYKKAQKDLKTKGSANIGGFTVGSGGGGSSWSSVWTQAKGVHLSGGGGAS